MKICGICRIEKSKDCFSKNSRLADGLSFLCRECSSEKSKKYQIENKEKIAKRKAAYRLENIESVKKIEKKASCRYVARNKMLHASRVASYRDRNPGKVAEAQRNAKAKRRGAIGSHVASDITAIFESQKGLCANCCAKLCVSGRGKFHIDHVMPLARGGSNDKYNLQCLCPPCNLKKNAKDPVDWAQENGRLI